MQTPPVSLVPPLDVPRPVPRLARPPAQAMTAQITGAVARGWLSRLSPGPWSGEADGAEPEVDVRDPQGELIGVISTHGPHENAAAVQMLPDILQAVVSLSGELTQARQALITAGIIAPHVHVGITELASMLTSLDGELRHAEQEYEQQGAEWTRTIDDLIETTTRLASVRSLLGEWGGRDMSEDALAFYRELTSRLMTTQPAEPSETIEELESTEGGTDGSNHDA